MFLNDANVLQDLFEFSKLLRTLTTTFFDKVSKPIDYKFSTKEEENAYSEQERETFFFVTFILIIAGERLSHFSAKNNLIRIRHLLSHKLFFIEPTEYATFLSLIAQDLRNLEFNDTFRFSKTLRFLEKNERKVVNAHTFLKLFAYWSDQYFIFYQIAIKNRPFSNALHPICEELTRKLDLSIGTDYRLIPSLSIVVIQGLLALRISQFLYPRDIQAPREDRSKLPALDQLLFDIQRLRNQVIHELFIDGQCMSKDVILMLMVSLCTDLVAVNRELKIIEPEHSLLYARPEVAQCYHLVKDTSPPQTDMKGNTVPGPENTVKKTPKRNRFFTVAFSSQQQEVVVKSTKKNL